MIHNFIHLHKVYGAVFPSRCICPGDTLTYECTVVGLGVTVWTGSAFSCPSSNNEIALLHSRFLSYGL